MVVVKVVVIVGGGGVGVGEGVGEGVAVAVAVAVAAVIFAVLHYHRFQEPSHGTIQFMFTLAGDLVRLKSYQFFGADWEGLVADRAVLFSVCGLWNGFTV